MKTTLALNGQPMSPLAAALFHSAANSMRDAYGLPRPADAPTDADVAATLADARQHGDTAVTAEDFAADDLGETYAQFLARNAREEAEAADRREKQRDLDADVRAYART